MAMEGDDKDVEWHCTVGHTGAQKPARLTVDLSPMEGGMAEHRAGKTSKPHFAGASHERTGQSRTAEMLKETFRAETDFPGTGRFGHNNSEKCRFTDGGIATDK